MDGTVRPKDRPSAHSLRGQRPSRLGSRYSRVNAKHVRSTTQEQSAGFARIRESVESLRDGVERINDSLQEQAQACNQVASFLEVVSGQTQSNEESVRSMGEATSGLVRQAEALREDVGRFQI